MNASVSQTVSRPVPKATLMSAANALAKRDILRFFRQPARMTGTVGQPLLFWLVLGMGLSPSFHNRAFGQDGMSYTEYFYPGILAMMVLFAGIFSTITLIEDRDQGFLQGVMAAPVKRLSIVLGKVMGGGAVAMMQAGILLLALPMMGFDVGVGSFALIVLTLGLMSLACTGFGFVVAWSMSSTAGYHGVMMLVMMPLWFLSSALFPMAGLPVALKTVMYCNPFTYMMIALREPFYKTPLECFQDTHYLTALGVTLVTITLVLWWAVKRVEKREHGVKAA